MEHGTDVPIVVPGLPTGSSNSTTSTSPTSLTQTKIPRQVQQQYDVEIPAVQHKETSCVIPSNWREIVRTSMPVQGTLARFARMVGGPHGKSSGRRSVSITGHTRKHFS